MPSFEDGKRLAQDENFQTEIVARAKEGGDVGQNCKSKLDHGQGQIGTALLASAFKDHAVVFVAQPKPGLSKAVELRAHGPHKPSLLGQTVDAGRSNHVRSEEHTSELQSLRHLVC